ncbi:unnamed protein product [Symbiodinium sp. CCMP2592]|nr:unnamed protein product [Symbiodinium sp. CCMP2592]
MSGSAGSESHQRELEQATGFMMEQRRLTEHTAYQAQQAMWFAARHKRGPPSTVESSMATPQQDTEMEEPQAGVDINSESDVQAYLATPLTTRTQVLDNMNWLATECRLFQINWMLGQVESIRQFLTQRSYNASDSCTYWYLGALQLEPSTPPAGDSRWSTVTILQFKSWDLRRSFMECYGGGNGTPLYREDNQPVPNHHIRCTPSSPQFQRKLEVPLRVVLALYNKHCEMTATPPGQIVILWRTLTVMKPSDRRDFNEQAEAWARVCYENEGSVQGILEVAPDLYAMLKATPPFGAEENTLWDHIWNKTVFGVQNEIDAVESQIFKQAQASAKGGGKGLHLGKGKALWSSPFIHSSTAFIPFPVPLAVNEVSAVAYSWDEYCDKLRDPSKKVGNYALGTYAGEEKARKRNFPNSQKVGDFAHLVGACARRTRTAGSSADQTAAAWRKGIFSTLNKTLTASGKKLLPLIRHTVYVLRSVPTLLLFHKISSLLFAALEVQEPSEKKAVAAMQKHYFTKLGRAQAPADLDFSGAFMWCADWWTGLQRSQPGSASGTQAQESWRRHKLKKAMGKLRNSLDTVVQKLNNFTQVRLEQLQAKAAPLPDVPQEPFPDRFVLWDSTALTAEGRSSASQYHRCRAFDVYSSGNTTCFAMKRTLASYSPDAGAWSRTPDEDVEPVPAGTAKALLAILEAKSPASLDDALKHMCENTLDLQALVKSVAKYVVVVVGPAAARWWQRGHSHDAEGENPYLNVACAFCNIFCLHGSCEHAHLALTELKHVSLTQAKLPSRREAREPTEHLAEVDMILPGPEALPCGVGVSAPAGILPRSSVSKPDPSMKALLSRCGAGSFLALFTAEQIGLPDLVTLDFPGLRAIFPNVPAGVLLRVHQAAAKA